MFLKLDQTLARHCDWTNGHTGSTKFKFKLYIILFYFYFFLRQPVVLLLKLEVVWVTRPEFKLYFILSNYIYMYNYKNLYHC